MAPKEQQHGNQSKERMADIGRKGGQHSHDKDQKHSPSRSDDDTSRSGSGSGTDSSDQYENRKQR